MNARDLVEGFWKESRSSKILRPPGDSLKPLSTTDEWQRLIKSMPHSRDAHMPTRYGSALKRKLKRVMARAIFGVLSKNLDEQREFYIRVIEFQQLVNERIDELSLRLTLLSPIGAEAIEIAERAQDLHTLLEQRLNMLENQQSPEAKA